MEGGKAENANGDSILNLWGRDVVSDLMSFFEIVW